jgi:hypothetical protein
MFAAVRSSGRSVGRVGLQLMLCLALFSYILLVMFSPELGLPAESQAAPPAAAAAAGSASTESRQVSQRT